MNSIIGKQDLSRMSKGLQGSRRVQGIPVLPPKKKESPPSRRQSFGVLRKTCMGLAQREREKKRKQRGNDHGLFTASLLELRNMDANGLGQTMRNTHPCLGSPNKSKNAWKSGCSPPVELVEVFGSLGTSSQDEYSDLKRTVKGITGNSLLHFQH